MGSKSFDIRNLLPFHNAGKGMPGSVSAEEEKIAQLDPNLNPEEQRYVSHYLGYADILLATPDRLESPAMEKQHVEEKVIEMPRGENQEQPAQDEAEAKEKEAKEVKEVEIKDTDHAEAA